MKELLQQALDALEQYTSPAQDLSGRPCRKPINESLCIALRSALATLQPEPVLFAQNPKDGFWCWCLPDEPGAIALYAAPPAAPTPATSADYAMGYAEGFNDACKPAPAVREPLTDQKRGDLVMEHLGPLALTGGKLNIFDAFMLGIDAAQQAHGIGGGGK